ncbi:MAG: hypothetical protein ACJ76Z_06115 [Thermoleophilaceae bacterium]
MGTDLLATVQEQGQRFLEPDEHVVAVFQAQPRGAGVARSGGGLGPQAVGEVWRHKSSKGAEGAGLQLASPMALALTERRIIVFTGTTSAGSGKIKEVTDLVSSAPLGDVESIQVKRLLLGKTVNIAMTDGEVKLEVPSGQDPKGFAAEFDRMKTTA